MLPEIPEFAKIVFLPVIGALLKHIWDRYRARLAALRWTVTYQAMAFATEDFGWGKVELLYNGSPANNLHMAYVQLQNASSRDLSDIRIDIVVDEHSSLLRSAGMLRSGTNSFPFADDYLAVLDKSSKGELPDAQHSFWVRRSPFLIPVLNRGATADFKILIRRADYDTPAVSIFVEHTGIKLLHQPPVKETFGVREGQAIATGIVTGVALSYAALRMGVPNAWAVGIAWILGGSALHLGAGIVRGWRALISLAD